MSDDLNWQAFDNIDWQEIPTVHSSNRKLDKLAKQERPENLVKHIAERLDADVKKIKYVNGIMVVITTTHGGVQYYYINNKLHPGYLLEYDNGVYWWFSNKYFSVYVPGNEIERYTRPVGSRHIQCRKFLGSIWILLEYVEGLKTYNILARTMPIAEAAMNLLSKRVNNVRDEIGIIKDPLHSKAGNVKILNKMTFDDALIFTGSIRPGMGIKLKKNNLVVKEYLIIWNKRIYQFTY